MKKKIKKLLKTMLFLFHRRRHEAFYHDVMRRNGIRDVAVDGEREWLSRWSQLGGKAKPTQYRVFSHYIGCNRDIVPEDVCHDFIEPLLNPFRFVGYYSDKNVFDRLFPAGYFPRTVLRKMNGFFYDADYRLVELTGDSLRRLLSAAGGRHLILKPSVDGMSGVGVRMFKIGGGGEILRLRR